MFGLSHWELLIILLVVMVVFGAKRLPMLGRGLGEGIRGFRQALKGENEEDKKEDPENGSKEA